MGQRRVQRLVPRAGAVGLRHGGEVKEAHARAVRAAHQHMRPLEAHQAVQQQHVWRQRHARQHPQVLCRVGFVQQKNLQKIARRQGKNEGEKTE